MIVKSMRLRGYQLSGNHSFWCCLYARPYQVFALHCHTHSYKSTQPARLESYQTYAKQLDGQTPDQ